jgi:carbon monoxide dehydrogenase subunit G
VRLEKEFRVARSREEAVDAVCQDETLVHLFPDSRTEIVESEGNRRTARSHYRALGREGVATFHFTFRSDGDVEFEKVCDGNVWRKLEGRVHFAESGKGTRVRIAMDGRTKTLVPEFTIKGPMHDQIEQMAKALKQRIESSQGS